MTNPVGASLPGAAPTTSRVDGGALRREWEQIARFGPEQYMAATLNFIPRLLVALAERTRVACELRAALEAGPSGTCHKCGCLVAGHHGPKLGCEGAGGNCGCLLTAEEAGSGEAGPSPAFADHRGIVGALQDVAGGVRDPSLPEPAQCEIEAIAALLTSAVSHIGGWGARARYLFDRGIRIQELGVRGESLPQQLETPKSTLWEREMRPPLPNEPAILAAIQRVLDSHEAQSPRAILNAIRGVGSRGEEP